jgi:hypothetical protein
MTSMNIISDDKDKHFGVIQLEVLQKNRVIPLADDPKTPIKPTNATYNDPEYWSVEKLEQDSIGQTQRTKQEPDEEWTTEHSVDELFLDLVKIKEVILSDDGKTIPVRKYYRKARQIMYWIPVVRLPSNEFVIYISDLSRRVRMDIESLIDTPKTLRYVLTKAVGRIFENLDFEYYHLSMARNLRVRIEP